MFGKSYLGHHQVLLQGEGETAEELFHVGRQGELFRSAFCDGLWLDFAFGDPFLKNILVAGALGEGAA